MTVDESIFVLSFNTNSAELSDEALQSCLKDAKGATMIICSFQEYDVPPRRCLPAPPAVYTGLGEEEEEQVEVEETKSRRKIKGNLQQQKYLRLWSSRKKAAEAGFAYTNTFDEGDVMRLSKLQKAIEALDDDEECDSSNTEEFVTDFPASSDIKGSSEGISNKYELVVDCAMGEAAGKCSSTKIEQGEG